MHLDVHYTPQSVSDDGRRAVCSLLIDIRLNSLCSRADNVILVRGKASLHQSHHKELS